MSIREADDTLEHISEKPWSDYTEADYTLGQWHAACLIHLHAGPVKSKSECKLPVKTPNGALNRNGVHAAAAALAGARSPIKAPPEKIAKAAAALRRLYTELGEDPPESLMAHTDISVDNILEHVGVKGMKWGVRRYRERAGDIAVGGLGISTTGSRARASSRGTKKKASRAEVQVSDKRKKLKTSGGKGVSAHPDAVRARTIGQVGKKSGLKALSNEELQSYAHRLQLEQNVKRLNYNELNPGKKFVATLLGRTGSSLASEGLSKGTKEVGKRAVKLATK